MSIYGEEVELFSVNYDFDSDDADDALGNKVKSDLIQYRALADVHRPSTFAAWGKMDSSFDTFSVTSTALEVGVASEDVLSAATSKEFHVRSSSERNSSFVEPLFGLPAASQFTVKERSSCDLIQSIGEYLNNSPNTVNFDFSFSPDDNTWKGKCLLGASCLEVDVRVYYRQASEEYVIAVLKMRGSEPHGISFMDFFSQLREHITGIRSMKRRRIDLTAFKFNSQSLPAPSCEEFLQGAAPILKMSSDECFEVRLEAAKMMCDMSTKSSDYLDIPEFKQVCLNIFDNLIHDPFEDVRQHAVMALAAFVELTSYQDAILAAESMLLPVLFDSISNAVNHEVSAWQTVKVRRTAASIVSVLCNRNATAVFDQLQRLYGIDVRAWAADLVPTLLDAKTKAYAEEIKLSLQILEQQAQSSCCIADVVHSLPELELTA